ncbi:MAG TPA: hypothetical protein VFQ40_07560 [Actinomycetota bacterium]|nr:hypothetical protein [Actinomycetota bacterium]
MASRRVASKGTLRLTAWVSAGLALAGSWGVLGWLPKPAPAVALDAPRPRKIVVIKRIVRRVIVQEQAAAPVTSAPAVTYVQAPASAPPAPTSTGGS